MRLAIVSAALLAAVIPVAARAATCTVTAAKVLVKDSGFERPLPEMIGYAIPVVIDETAGSFQADFTGLPVGTFSISGVSNSLEVKAAGPVTGTIDGGGNVSLPPTQVDFTTALLPLDVLSTMEPLSTGIAAVTKSGNDYTTEGAPLDFSTGSLRLEGQGIVTNAPVVGTSTSGFSVTCTLAPIPSAASLPKAPTVTAHGVGKPGKSSDPAAVAGDTVTIKAKIKNGAKPLDPTADVFVRVGVDGTDVFLVRVVAGTLENKGKKYSVSDDDGSKVHLVIGRKEVGNVRADLSGSLMLAQGKKSLAVTLKQTGSDLAPLASATTATLTVGVGPTSLSDQATVKASTKKTVLK